MPSLPRAPAASGGGGRLLDRAVRAGASLLICGLRICAYSTSRLFYLPISGLLAGGGCGENKHWCCYYNFKLRSYSDLTCAQPIAVWTGTTWPASLGWPSGPASVTQEGSLACFFQQARGPRRCHTDRLPGLLLTACLMAHQTPLSGLVLFCCTASAVVAQAHTFTHSIFTHCRVTGLST